MRFFSGWRCTHLALHPLARACAAFLCRKHAESMQETELIATKKRWVENSQIRGRYDLLKGTHLQKPDLRPEKSKIPPKGDLYRKYRYFGRSFTNGTSFSEVAVSSKYLVETEIRGCHGTEGINAVISSLFWSENSPGCPRYEIRKSDHRQFFLPPPL